MWMKPSCSATARAVELLPLAAGPSMAMPGRLRTMEHPLERREERGIGNRDAGAVVESDLRAGQRAEDRERHGQPVIAGGLDQPGGRALGPFHPERVLLGLGLDAEPL